MQIKRLFVTLTLSIGLTLTLLWLLGGGIPVANAESFTVTTTNDENNGGCPGPSCSLREAIIAANGNGEADTISLPAGTFTLTITGTDEDASATGDLDIISLDTLTIIGAGPDLTIIDANGIDRVLHIHTGTVVISGVTIFNGSVAGSGGGIYYAGTDLMLINTIVYSNSAPLAGEGGGGVLVYRANAMLSMSGGKVHGNSAYLGGGIAIHSGSTILNGTQVYGNSASDSGGGVFVYQANAMLSMSGTQVYSNSASYYGGGVSIEYGSATLSGTQVYSNSASWDGGGVYVREDSATLSVSGTQVYGNSAYSGGGVRVNSSSATLNGTQVYNNSASSWGGGVFVGSGSVALNGTQVYSNSAYWGGGGVYVSDGSAALGGAQVYSNSVSSNGGGMYVYDGRVILSGTLLHDNSAGSNGGGAYVSQDGASVDISESEISRNTARGTSSESGGGGVYVHGGSTTLTETVVASNTALFGGGVYVNLDSAALRMSGGQVSHNDTDLYGGGMYVNQGSAVFSGTVVFDNSAPVGCGGGMLVDSGNIVLTRTVVSSNVAAWGGGAYVWHESAKLCMSEGQVGYNAASQRGGGVHVEHGGVALSGTAIFDNAADIYGGGIYVESGSGVLTRTVVSGNMAVWGGGVYVNLGSANLRSGGGRISRNTASVDGGGIYVNQGEAMVSGGQIVSNSTSWNGGGLYIGSGSVTLSGAQIAANTAITGSGLYNSAGVITSTTPLTIAGNVYQADGTFAGSNHDLHIEGSLSLAGGDWYAPANLWLTGPFTHTGGTYRQTQFVNGSSDVGFPKIGGAILNANGQDLGSTEVLLTAGASCAGVTAGEAVSHCAVITPTVATGRDATITFFYNDSEIPSGHSCAAMEAYRWSGIWKHLLTRDGSYGSDGRMCGSDPRSIRVTGVTTFSPFALTNLVPEVSIAKTVTPTEAPLGGIVTYTVVIRNVGGAVASNVVMTDPLPSAVIFGEWVGWDGSAVLPPPGTAGLPTVTITWSPGDLAAGTTYTLSFTAHVVTDTQFAGQTVDNVAYVITDNADSDDDSASFTIEDFYIYLPVVMRNH